MLELAELTLLATLDDEAGCEEGELDAGLLEPPPTMP
jgi:hypothetical protein